MATLEEILALLPDNTTGDISAADVRFAVTELWAEANDPNIIRGVKVVAGTEARPVGTDQVIWRDLREDFSTPPVNIGPDDTWLTPEDSPPPPGDGLTVFGTDAPAGSWSMGEGELPTITFGRGFYKFDSSDPTSGMPNARVIGGRVWIPDVVTLPTEVTFTLYGPDANLASTIVQTKAVAIPGGSQESWIEGLFDTPQDMGADGAIWMIGARFSGPSDAGKYVFGSGTRPSSAAVLSTSGKNFAWAEQTGGLAALSSQFRVGSGAPVTPSEQTQSYGVDIVLDEGA